MQWLQRTLIDIHCDNGNRCRCQQLTFFRPNLIDVFVRRFVLTQSG
jgi:hypothetical protein